MITAALVVATGAAIYEAREISQLRNQVRTLAIQPAPFAEQREKLLSQLYDVTNQLAAANVKIAQLSHQLPQEEVSSRATADD